MRRLFWLGVGVAAGAVLARKLSSTVAAYTPQGIAASLQSSATGAMDEVRSFVADVRAASAEREARIREDLPSTALGRPDDVDPYR